jgi:hypothetical protein
VDDNSDTLAGNMPAWDDQRVKERDRVGVSYGIDELISQDDAWKV